MTPLLLFLLASPASVAALRLNKGEEEMEVTNPECIWDNGVCYNGDGEEMDETISKTVNFAEEQTDKPTCQSDPQFAKVDSMNILENPTFEKLPESDCPKIFIYDLPAPFQDQPDFMNIDELATFGQHLQGDVYNTRQFFATKIIAWKVLNSKRCRTTDPKKADLFFIPMLAMAKTASKWARACGKVRGKQDELLKLLPHLNEATAKKHFMVLNKGFYNADTCFGIWRQPEGLFKEVARVNVEMHVDQNMSSKICGQHSDDINRFGNSKGQAPNEYPRLYNMPYPSAYHSKMDNAPWSNTKKRQYLASFVGKTGHGDTKVRGKIGGTCGKPGVHCEDFTTNDRNAMVKRESTFCFEPVGDSIGRKSMFDAYAAGCIPVFFGNAQGYQFPSMWAGWEKDAYVAINRQKFIRGELDVVKELQSIPESRIIEMRASIRKNAIRLLYAKADLDEVDDAVSLMMKQLVKDSGDTVK